MASIQPRTILESYFDPGDVPTSAQFANFIASYIHKTDDGISIFEKQVQPIPPLPAPAPPPEWVYGLEVADPMARLSISALTDYSLISFHKDPLAGTASWTLSTDTSGDDLRLASSVDTNAFYLQALKSRVGIGTDSPRNQIHLAGSEASELVGVHVENASSGVAGWGTGQVADVGYDRQGAYAISWYHQANDEYNEVITATRTNHVGVNRMTPYVSLHVGPDSNSVGTNLNSGLAVFGGLGGRHVVVDQNGVQGRTGTANVHDPQNVFDDTYTVQAGSLDIQVLGGDLNFHRLGAAGTQAILLTSGEFGIGTNTPTQKLDVNGYIRVGSSGTDLLGSMRYNTGSKDIEGYVDTGGGAQWKSFTAGGGGTAYWISAGTANNIYYPTGAGISNVGIGVQVNSTSERLEVADGIKIGQARQASNGTIQYLGNDFLGYKNGQWVSLTTGGAPSTGPWLTGGNGIYYGTPTKPTRRVGINTGTTIGTTLDLISDDDQDFIAAQFHSKSKGANANLNRIGVHIKNDTTWNGVGLDIGLIVSNVSGKSQSNSNIAAMFNGNVVVGTETAGQTVVGIGGTNVVAIQQGTTGSIPSEVQFTTQIFTTGYGPIATDTAFSIRNGNGQFIQLFRESGIDSAMSEEWQSGTLQDKDQWDNMRDRINFVVDHLTRLGLIS